MLEVLHVHDARVAKVFSNTSQRHLLLELAGHERSLQWLASRLSLPLSLAHYHIGRLLALGLIRITRQEPRAGRSIKHYRALARSFFVPAHLTSRSPGVMLAAELREALERGGLGGSDGGTEYFVDDQMLPRMRRIQRRSRRVTVESWRILNLTEKLANALANDMKALLLRYEGLTSDRGCAYLAHSAIVPRKRKRRGK